MIKPYEFKPIVPPEAPSRKKRSLAQAGAAGGALVGGPAGAVVGGTLGFIGDLFMSSSKAEGAKQDVQADKDKMLIDALSFAHLKEVADINYQKAIADTERILVGGAQQISYKTLEAGRSKATFMTQLLASGHTMATGSLAEMGSSMDLIKEMDSLTIASNVMSLAQDMQTQKASYALASQAHAMTVAQMRKAASALSPSSAGTTSLLGDLGSIAKGVYEAKGIVDGSSR